MQHSVLLHGVGLHCAARIWLVVPNSSKRVLCSRPRNLNMRLPAVQFSSQSCRVHVQSKGKNPRQT